MRLANLEDRGVLVASDTAAVEIATASKGRFGPDLTGIYDDWNAFRAWAATYPLRGRRSPFAMRCWEPRGPRPREVELVVVIGHRGWHIPEANAWDYVAGLSVGQDLSERISQRAGPVPQFSFGKSHAGFGSVGPWLITPDDLPNRNDLELGCTIGGVVVQKARTSDLIYPVDKLIAALSAGVTLLPGDLIFTRHTRWSGTEPYTEPFPATRRNADQLDRRDRRDHPDVDHRRRNLIRHPQIGNHGFAVTTPGRSCTPLSRRSAP